MKNNLPYFSYLFFAVSLFICVWLIPQLGFLIFLSFVPFFMGIKIAQQSGGRKFLKILSFFLLFQLIGMLGASNWLIESSFQSYLIGVFFMTLTFVIVFLPSIYLFSKYANNLVYWFFIFNWIIYEFISQSIPLMTPYYLLGFSLGGFPALIQNYSIIGVEGGTLWILLVNISIYNIFQKRKHAIPFKLYDKIGFVFSVSLFFISLLINCLPIHKTSQINVAVLYVKINQTEEKYRLNPQLMVDELWRLSLKGIDKNTDILVWPETVITNFGWGHEINNNVLVSNLFQKMNKYSKLNLTFGANLYSLSNNTDDPKLNRDYANNLSYFSHNIAFTIRHDKTWMFRSKETFIAFQEEIPFLSYFPKLREVVSFVGNRDIYSSFDGGVNDHQTLSKYTYHPVLCYEICYPLKLVDKLKNNNFLALLTNEQWNNNIIGSKQYLNCITGVSIQNGIPILKSSNGGISAIISKNGKIIDKEQGKSPRILHEKIELKQKNTPYELLSGYSYFCSIILMFGIFIILRRLTNS
jgi:apolipoprotein N-acyltransferase